MYTTTEQLTQLANIQMAMDPKPAAYLDNGLRIIIGAPLVASMFLLLGHGRFMLRMGSPLHEAVESGITDCAYGAACVHLVLFPVESNYCFKLADNWRVALG